MRVVVAGSRTIRSRQPYTRLCEILDPLIDKITELVSGGAPGMDLLGEKWGKARGVPVKRFLADWDKHGKPAGVIRNGDMGAYAAGGLLVALWDGQSRGTADMIRKAVRHGMAIHVETPVLW